MHPAYSVIFFTTASGAGYGLLALLAIFAAAGLLPPATWLGFTGLGLALGLIASGLVSSTFHLGRPERALGALTQWRSSWLSREGILAILTFIPAGLFGLSWVFLNETQGAAGIMGVIAAVLGMMTVTCTAMIYASLKPIRQWHNALVPVSYLTLGLMTGALLLVLLTLAFSVYRPLYGGLALVLVLAGWIVKAGYWWHIDTAPAQSTLATATGLGRLGDVRLLEMPHTEANYIMQEMGFEIARKHARKLRLIAHLTLFLVPLVLMLVVLLSGGILAGGILAGLAAFLAVLSAGAGIVTERWLFFAEATHTSLLYYGRNV